MKTFLIPTGFSIRNQEHIYVLQQALLTLQYKIDDEEEIRERRFGETTKAALMAFKKDFCLPLCYDIDLDTVNMFNRQLENLYRICGFVTNSHSLSIEGAAVVVYQISYSGQHQEIGRGLSLSDGAYCVYLSIPQDYTGKDGLLMNRLCIRIDCLQDERVMYSGENLFVQNIETLFNIVSDAFSYKGDSVYQSLTHTLMLHGIKTADLLLKEPADIGKVTSFTGISEELLMKIMLSEAGFNGEIPEALFGYLYQSYPQNVPLQLFDDYVKEMKKEEWESYKETLLAQVNTGLLLMPQSLLYNILAVACKQYFIDGHDQNWIQNIVTIITNKQNDALSEQKMLEGEVSVALLIEKAGTSLDEKQKKEIADLFIANLSNFNTFLAVLDSEENREKYTDEAVDRLLAYFQVSRVTRNYTDLTDQVLAAFRDDLIKDIRYIASVTPEKWKEFVSQSGYPEPFTSQEEYIGFVSRNIQELYPDIASLSRVESLKDFPKAAKIKDILLRNREFDMLTNRIEDCKEYEEISQDPELLQEFKTIQQVYRISPSPETAAVMLDNGIRSSGQVYFTGKRQMEELFKDKLPQKEIDAVFDIASGRFSNSLAAFANISEALNGVNVKAVSGYDLEALVNELKSEFPDIETLFGTTDYCECRHDSSVYSAAAYLADLLYFLDNRKTGSDTSLRDYLNKRRPDLSNIYLNEHNTNTTLPYIDLVCEVLEEAVLKTENPQYERSVEESQSTLSSRELYAAPEHVLLDNGQSAYDILKESIYPMYAPLNLAQTESRAYLEKMGIARYRLMQVLTKDSENPREVTIASEYFGLTNLEQEIIAAEDTLEIAERNEAWIKPVTGAVTTMTMLEFMRDSGLSAYEVMDIVKAPWTKVSCENFAEDCSYKEKQITGSESGFDRTHRFIRLWRKTGWKIGELDLLLRSVPLNRYDINNDNLDSETLCNLMLFRQQQEELNLDCEGLLAFYDRMNVQTMYENGKEQATLYEKLFLSKPITNPPNKSLEDIRENPEAVITDADDALVAACLSVSEADYFLLKGLYSGAKDLSFLSYVYRNSVLAKKLNITIRELLSLCELKAFDFLAPYSLHGVNDLIATYKEIKASKTTIPEYEYLVKYVYGDGEVSDAVRKIALTDKQLQYYYETIKAEVLKHPEWGDITGEEGAFSATPEYKGSFIKHLSGIELYSNPADMEEIIRVIECRSDKTDEEIDIWAMTFFPGVPVELLYQKELTSWYDLEERYFNVVLFINTTYTRVAIRQHIAAFFDLSGEIADIFLSAPLIPGVESSSLFLYIVFYCEQQIVMFNMLTLIHKMALTVKKNDLNDADLKLLFAIQSKIHFRWLDFKIAEDQQGTISLEALLRLAALERRQKLYGTKEDMTLFDVINNVDESSEDPDTEKERFYRDLCSLTGWDNEIFKDSIASACLNLDEVIYFYHPAFYARIDDCMEIVASAGVSVQTVTGWRTRDEIAENSESVKSVEIKNAAKAHSSAGAWLDELPALQKPLREAKSDALASYLIAYSLRLGGDQVWQSKTDLYAYFLLDTEMSACMKTSRIVQGTCSVQLLVQRCFLGLETGITINEETDHAWKQWDWMKKYRLWEANRKIFLYPENWIEPELRDDKTVFFKELEDELEQSDITREQAEVVFENYLQKLHAVANLTICGIYREKVESNDGFLSGSFSTQNTLEEAQSKVDKLHVIGRSKSSPYQFYYRYYDALNAIWSHWEKIELDIKGDVVVPMVYNRKVHLFWISLTEKTYNNAGKGNNADNIKDPDNYTEVQLGWSILKNKKWTGASYSQKRHIQYGHRPVADYSLLAWYDEERNEVLFRIDNFYYENRDKAGEYHSCCYQAGIIFFNGEVYRIASNINYFPTESSKLNGYTQEDVDRLISQYILRHPMASILMTPRLAALFNLKSQLDALDAADKTAEKIALFQRLTGKMEYDEKPEIITRFSDEDSVAYPVKSVLRSSRLYQMELNADQLMNVHLHDITSSDYYTTRIFTTNHQDANLVQMLHNQDSLTHGLFESTLSHPFFYQDSQRTFFIRPGNIVDRKTTYTVSPFYHPYATLFIKELNRLGIGGILNRNIQTAPQHYVPLNTFRFSDYAPADHITLEEPYQTDTPGDILDFHLSGAYSIYNWELFFHVPLYIACKLSQNQKYEEAMEWFHYIFSPTDKSSVPSPQKFWITKPFHTLSTTENRKQQIRNILENIEEHAAEVNAWLNNPYKPHLVARTRPVAYQRTVVMKYIDNLIAWADQLFRNDSMESNNEATLLYILAYEILGKRPVMLPENDIRNLPDVHYNKIKAEGVRYVYLEAYQNSYAYDYRENTSIQDITDSTFTGSGLHRQASHYPSLAQSVSRPRAVAGEGRALKSIDFLSLPPVENARSKYVSVQNRQVRIPNLYKAVTDPLPGIDADHFCIPYNENLLAYWDTVEDRLFKLRNCMNIEGVVRELPLFEPPIDPAMLVKAAAAGLSISDALNDLNAPQPYYRFRVILQKAVEFAGEVKQLGDKMLSALEKKDAEILSLLRSSQEITMQQAMRQVRKLQIDEAKRNMESIDESIRITESRKAYYESREYMNGLEVASYTLATVASAVMTGVGIGKAAAGAVELVPEVSSGGAGFAASPVVVINFGGPQLSGSADKIQTGIGIAAEVLDKTSSLLLTQAGYKRRQEEWDFQAQMAGLELQQLDKQRAAAEIRQMMAEKELENLEMQIEQSQSVKEYYQYKYTNQALYNWMITQLSTVYFQAYRLAYDMARKAEKCYHHELGIYQPSGFIRPTYWDSLKKGLLSGEMLIHDLHRLDAAYIDNNKRDIELTKHLSLAQMFPQKLIELVTTGKIDSLELKEFIFDMDYPGHYMRRIKSVSVTIPNVAGPYTNVSCMLTLLSARVRKNTELRKTDSTGNGYDEVPGEDTRFYFQTGGNQSIFTSSAQNDSGMFELNFGDERYLPFEGAGVISRWRLSLPAGCNQFDVSTISDVILHIRYTAAYDGQLAEKAKEVLPGKLPEAGALLVDLKQDFPDAWNKMSDAEQTMQYEVKPGHLPFFMRGQADAVEVGGVSAMLSSMVQVTGGIALTFTRVDEESNESKEFTLSLSRQVPPRENGNIFLYSGTSSGNDIPSGLFCTGKWTMKLSGIAPEQVENLIAGFALQVEA